MSSSLLTAIVTDSTACIPSVMRESLNITEIPYYIHKGGEVLRDLVTIQRDEFLSYLPAANPLPTTACPGTGDYLNAYETLAGNGTRNIISIHMTSKGSGAYQAAMNAAAMLHSKLPKIRIEVIDTLNVALCQGWIAIEAARDALLGISVNDILEKIRKMIPITRMIQTADTLRYLYMGGRIGKAAQLVGSMLSLKPLISMEKGEIMALGVTRGLNKAYEKMVENLIRIVGESTSVKIAYMHAGALQNIFHLKEMVESRLQVVESFISELTPALMVHTGPGTTGFCFYPVKKQ
jgi:DegV family protein with EDD domain